MWKPGAIKTTPATARKPPAGSGKHHVGNIYSKLGVANRRQALLKAQSLGWHSAA